MQFGLSSPPEFKSSYNIAPGAQVLVVGSQGGVRARWGMRGRFVNLRAETVLAKFSRSGRCLVPASGFYEWQAGGGRKQPYYFVAKSEALLALAAVWEQSSFSLVTTEPSATVARVHDRMPLLIARDGYSAWLAGDERLLRKPVEVEIDAHPVSMAVNQAANDSPRLIEPVELPRSLFD